MRTLIYSLIFVLGTLVFFPTTSVFAQLPTSTPTPRAALRATIFLPVIANDGGQSSSNGQGLQQSGAVYGLVGHINKAVNQSFSNYLITPNNVTYGIVGATVAVEQEIAELRDRQPPILVKIWGNVATATASTPVIVVSALLAGDPAPTPTPAVLAPTAQPTVRVKYDLVNLYAGPGTTYATTGQVRANQICTVTARNAVNTWWQIKCANNLIGWIDGRLGETSGQPENTPIGGAVATLTPRPTATPLPSTPTPVLIPSNVWRATYFNNVQLEGSPALVADVANLNLNWGTSRPDPAITTDFFSARFERTIYFNPGFYRFIAATDDGIRVWLDGVLLFNEWHGASGQVYIIGRNLSGNHAVRVEYYNVGGLAELRFTYTLINDSPVWTANYFAGAELTGAPLFSQQEPRSAAALDYNWGATSPTLDVVPANNWSARWVGQFRFEAGNYIFRANADDGVRVYINDQLVINDWVDGYHETSNRFLGIGANTHTIRVEYYKRTGSGRVRVWWSRDIGGQPVPQ